MNAANNSTIQIQTFDLPCKHIVISNFNFETKPEDWYNKLNKTYYASHSNGMRVLLVRELAELLNIELEFSQSESLTKVYLYYS